MPDLTAIGFGKEDLALLSEASSFPLPPFLLEREYSRIAKQAEIIAGKFEQVLEVSIDAYFVPALPRGPKRVETFLPCEGGWELADFPRESILSEYTLLSEQSACGHPIVFLAPWAGSREIAHGIMHVFSGKFPPYKTETEYPPDVLFTLPKGEYLSLGRRSKLREGAGYSAADELISSVGETVAAGWDVPELKVPGMGRPEPRKNLKTPGLLEAVTDNILTHWYGFLWQALPISSREYPSAGNELAFLSELLVNPEGALRKYKDGLAKAPDIIISSVPFDPGEVESLAEKYPGAIVR
ncbi:MAG: hypothetical protein V1820_02805 [archaeon]